jgi:uncharacterized protein
MSSEATTSVASAANERTSPMSTSYDALRAPIRRELPHFSDQEVEDLVWCLARLIEVFRPERIYVFGSHARGAPHPNSDIDLMVVVGETEDPPHRLDQRGYEVLEPFRLPIELVFMNSNEFERRLPALASLPATVVREGRLLYAA